MKITKKIGGGGGGFGSGWGRDGGVRVDLNEELKFLCKFKKEIVGGGGGGGCGRVGGGQGGCERRIEVLVKIQKKMGGAGGQSGCERSSEVFVKIQKKKSGGGGGRVGGVGFGGGGVRVDVNEELKFL